MCGVVCVYVCGVACVFVCDVAFVYVRVCVCGVACACVCDECLRILRQQLQPRAVVERHRAASECREEPHVSEPDRPRRGHNHIHAHSCARCSFRLGDSKNKKIF